jgi:hypothetical protein
MITKLPTFTKIIHLNIPENSHTIICWREVAPCWLATHRSGSMSNSSTYSSPNKHSIILYSITFSNLVSKLEALLLVYYFIQTLFLHIKKYDTRVVILAWQSQDVLPLFLHSFYMPFHTPCGAYHAAACACSFLYLTSWSCMLTMTTVGRFRGRTGLHFYIIVAGRT